MVKHTREKKKAIYVLTDTKEKQAYIILTVCGENVIPIKVEHCPVQPVVVRTNTVTDVLCLSRVRRLPQRFCLDSLEQLQIPRCPPPLRRKPKFSVHDGSRVEHSAELVSSKLQTNPFALQIYHRYGYFLKRRLEST